MKKFSIALITGLLFASVVQAQSLQEGINDLYAERYKSAKATFDKLLASNPNNIEATYWLGQVHLEQEDVAGAKALYEKALLASANAPLVIVGMGQVELTEKKVSEARQRFEAAITMTRGKKGDDPQILNAVGRAITSVYTEKNKLGDINYAVQQLELASQQKKVDNALLADIYLNLGNAYRKAKPGEGGGQAYQAYNSALGANANFAAASHRLAKLFESQKNSEMFEKYLNEAITKDPRFAPAYYDLYYTAKDLTVAEQWAKKYIESSDADPQNDYLRVQTLWKKGSFDEAIAGAKNIIAQAGAATKARTYKLIADAYVQKKDTPSAKQYIDEYFAKAKPEEVLALDYKLKADVYSAIPGQEEALFAIYQEGVKADTVLNNKVELLKKGAEFFKNKGQREKEGDLLQLLVNLKPKPTINEMFDVGRAYYFGGAYAKSYAAFDSFQVKYPDEVYGYEWKFNNAKAIDTTKRDSIAVPMAESLLAFAEKDTAKYKKQYITAALYLVDYWANYGKDGAKATQYIDKALIMDPTNESYKNVKKQLEKSAGAAPRSSNQSPKTGSSGKFKAAFREMELV
ncbi:MAG: tetratricopeptide repeat protein [Chitinophagaceae bacterium]|nr:MAG: tetratricopeptide repeat protein [Chitinophagaceae bacterium]